MASKPAVDADRSKVFACKVITFQATSSLTEIESEYRILCRLQHPGIVRYVDYQCTPLTTPSQTISETSPRKLRLFMEYCSEGSLQDWINDMQRSV